MDSISAIIITKNEELNIGRCLDSVQWVDEIIVVDSASVDDTREIAWEKGATVHETEWRGYGPTKAFGVDQSTSKWILSVDADEEVTANLAREIKEILRNGTRYHGFDMPRKTNFLGRWIKHCGWYPDRVLRLFRKSNGGFDESLVHERVVLDGSMGHLKGELLHYSYPSLEHYLKKSNDYTTLGAQSAFQRGRRAGWFDIVIRPPVSFITHYIIRQGFRDGFEGLLVSALSSVAVLVKYAKLRDMQKKQYNMEVTEIDKAS